VKWIEIAPSCRAELYKTASISSVARMMDSCPLVRVTSGIGCAPRNQARDNVIEQLKRIHAPSDVTNFRTTTSPDAAALLTIRSIKVAFAGYGRRLSGGT
jgi:hypothetical protein